MTWVMVTVDMIRKMSAAVIVDYDFVGLIQGLVGSFSDWILLLFSKFDESY